MEVVVLAEVEVLQKLQQPQNPSHKQACILYITNHHTSKIEEKRAFVNDDDNYDDYDGKNAHFFKKCGGYNFLMFCICGIM
jgi:hypothetical protein